ncbi:LysR family transcriptional regulator substrate-binding protein [Nonomuraea angiospora]|uniref:LysR family transcriptional regulator substrate-binding protein n=1 Tax=Nonomuraea angiospora TaxID=46172 RepID=UPI00299FE641|nr:LysR family transcriptional regulator substrate-binding protein [Nonomuraea angiospora]MDX3109102.1 LysR family transcriptional regulator substrate-binding protein [Nonomuraea angiospora]
MRRAPSVRAVVRFPRLAHPPAQGTKRGFTSHPLTARPAVTLADLAGRPFILTTAGCRPLIMGAALTAQVRLDVAFEASGPAAILEMVAAGLGVSIVPTLGLPADLSTVVTRPLEPKMTRSLALAVPSADDCAPTARAFLDQLGAFTL